MAAELVAVTIGIGHLHETLATEAAARMRRLAGVDVRILGRRDLALTALAEPIHLKFRLFDLVDAENVLFFDSDAFCLRPWEPRAYINRLEWVAVRGFWFDDRVRHLGRLYGFGDETFNGGLFLCNRTNHASVLRLAEAIQPPDGQFPGLQNHDEIAFGAAQFGLGVAVNFLDRRLNWIQYGRGDLAGYAAVTIAHACSPELRPAYLAGEALAGRAEGPAEAPAVRAEFAGKIFQYTRVGHDSRPLTFRADGTIGDGAGDAERYWLAVQKREEGRLTLGSVFDETCTLARGADGSWRGRWSHHERMEVILTRHHAQTVLDLLAAQGSVGRPLVGVEVGGYRGETSGLLLRGLAGLRLFIVGLWPDSAGSAIRRPEVCEQVMDRATAVTDFAAERRRLIPCEHVDAARCLPGDLDLIFLNGRPSESATYELIKTWWPKAKPDGLVAGRDYGNPRYPGVRRAVNTFAEKNGLEVYTGPDWVWWYCKRRRRAALV